jgi:CheY-like chemotaxis protein
MNGTNDGRSFSWMMRIRARPGMNFPLVVFRGSSFDLDREHSRESGADAFVAKQIGLSELVKCVRVFLEAELSHAR